MYMCVYVCVCVCVLVNQYKDENVFYTINIHLNKTSAFLVNTFNSIMNIINRDWTLQNGNPMKTPSTHTHTRAHTRIQIYLYIYVYIYVCMCVCIHVCIRCIWDEKCLYKDRNDQSINDFFFLQNSPLEIQLIYSSKFFVGRGTSETFDSFDQLIKCETPRPQILPLR